MWHRERAVLDEQEKAMKEYKALLEADRARRLEGSKDSKHDSSRRKKVREWCSRMFHYMPHAAS